MAYTNNVLDWLDESVRSHPNKTAYADSDSEISYVGLKDMVDRIGTALAELGFRNKPVINMVERDALSVAGFLGTVASGNFYVPIDPDMPAERLETIFKQVEPSAIIVHGNTAGDAYARMSSCPIMCLEEMLQHEARQDALASVRECHTEDDPLYAICTSGSTGIPKVVLKSHRSVLSFMPIFAETFGFDDNEVFANQAPFDFDVSAKDIYTTLYCASSMHVVPRSCFTMPKSLAPFMQERGVTCCIWAVSALCVVAQLNAFKNTRPDSLRKVLFSGEVMPPKHLAKWQSWYPHGTFVNLYAPSEATGNCLYHVAGTGEGPNGRLPLGKPFKNCQVLIVNSDNEPISPGEEGEIYLGCPNLALGYYRDPKRTAASFVQDPTCTDWPKTMYRTGDIARMAEDGSIFFAGRADFQIKHMGHRIELEELELHINNIDGIDRACCLFDVDKGKIVAFYEGCLTPREIILELGKNLPKYMIPNVFNQIDSIPITSRGKIDRKLLLELSRQPR